MQSFYQIIRSNPRKVTELLSMEHERQSADTYFYSTAL